MFIVLAQFKIKPGTKDEFIRLAGPLVMGSRAEVGCLSYELFESTERENVLIIVEKWIDRAVFENHVATAHFEIFGKTAGPLLIEERDVRMYPAYEECQ
ncbi:putative quinol monooxygenase [Methanolapillus ohkumae]|uniref:Monooxygenase YcnE n=1 Tax=Methanolapillus ohkumae TaxID=3028298 RepID=A0AA96ZVK0_9EURY|nr:Putative monooxygenase YcnE [Methanosarcinaceae archaeon Am2]